MSSPHLPKVAGIDPSLPAPTHTSDPVAPPCAPGPGPGPAVQDHLAAWVSDLTTLHELTERLALTGTLEDALDELLRAGAGLVGARRGLVALEPADGLGPVTTVGLGLGRADLGHIETIPRGSASAGHLLDGLPEPDGERRSGVAHPDIPGEPELDPRHREVAARLGYSASYAMALDPPAAPGGTAGATGIAGAARPAGRLGAAAWLYDEPAEPAERQRHLVGLYCRYAAAHIARLVELSRARATVATVQEELLPTRLPRIPGVRLAVRHRAAPRGGGDWYDALPLPDGALGLSVGAVTGSGAGAVAAMGRLRASLRAYAVMEGEDPVAVLSDLELLLRLTEPARSATALFAYYEPLPRRMVLAGAGHCPPLITGERRTEFLETALSAPLGMLSCWEAPSVEFQPGRGETLLFYSDGLLHRTGEPLDRAFARLHRAAASAPGAVRNDPEGFADHLLRTVLPDAAFPDAAFPDAAFPDTTVSDAHRADTAPAGGGRGGGGSADDGTEDVVLLVAHFD
ncbi:PP2C family protein-serine/threonine phosphatase [Streptomyces sparsogenes]|uniref:PP2C family protein-serine/threonine phosphatase n=1 Tax=Streptomyces sparsogenes TaxID=67365 RepID=UPI00384EFCA2